MIPCAVCAGPDATETKKALNGLPLGVWACADCRQAVGQHRTSEVADARAKHLENQEPSAGREVTFLPLLMPFYDPCVLGAKP